MLWEGLSERLNVFKEARGLLYSDGLVSSSLAVGGRVGGRPPRITNFVHDKHHRRQRPCSSEWAC